MQMPALSEADEFLQELLTQEQILEPRQLNQALAAREQGWQRALRRFVGIWCGIVDGRLLICDYLQQRELNAFELESSLDPDFQQVTVFYRSPEEGLERATLPVNETGLLMTNDNTWLQTRDPLDTPFLGLSRRLQVLPGHDLAISPRKDLLAVSERAAGRLHLISLNKPQILASFEVREPGSHKAINLCFCPSGPQRGRLWLSDQESDRLGWIDPQQPELNWWNTGLGRLGQLSIHPEGAALYLLALTPLLRLIRIDPLEQRILAELDLPGSPASLTPGVPTDTLEYDNSHHELLLLTQEHGQGSPMLLRVSPELTFQAEAEALPPIAGWAMLLPSQSNPVQKWAIRRLDDFIAELEFLTAEHLARLRQQARFGGLIGRRDSSYEVPQGNEDPLETLYRSAPPIHLPAETLDLLVDLLVQGFYQETGQNLRKYPRELERLKEEAQSLKTRLESHYVALSELEEVLGKHTLQQVFSRDSLLRSLDYHLGGKQLPFRPGHCCPICALALKNPRLCKQCGFVLDDPEWHERRERQSAESCSELIPGQMLLALPKVRQLVLMDAWQQVVSEFQGSGEEGTPLREPWHVLALPDQNWLVCDREAAQVYELSPSGELIALLDHRFKEPLLATFRREGDQLFDILVLDSGSQEICSFSRAGRLMQSWGAADGLRLKKPSDLQFSWAETFLITEPDSPRVLEWDPASQQNVQHWDSKQGLKRPVLARRQLNGDTLIVDAGRGEILIFAADNPELQRSYRYWPPPGFEQLVGSEPAPERMLVLPQGELICLGQRYWLQIQLTLGKIRWVQPWTGRRRPPQQKKKLESLAQEDESLKRLRQIQILRPLETASLQAVASELEVLVCEADQTVLRANDMNGILFFILEGELEMQRADNNQVIAQLGPGDSFGEVPLMLSEPFAARFQSKTQARLMQLKRSNFKKAIAKASELAPVLRELAHQRKFLLSQSQNQAQQGVMDKVKAQLAIKRLQELKLFAHADEALLNELAECIRPLAFMPAKMIFEQDHEFGSLYFISRGQVAYYLKGARKPFLTLGPGDVFGELALLNQQIHPASARSESYCQLYELDPAGFARILLQRPDLKDELKTLALERMPELEAARNELAYQPAESESLPLAEVLSLNLVRPAMGYLVSDFHEQAFCLDEKGQIHWRSEGSKARLYQPTRLSVGDDLIWIADTGHQRLVALTRADGRYVRELNTQRLDLAEPRSVVQTLQQHLLIADASKQQLLLVSSAGERLWQYGPPQEIACPWFAEQTLKGTILFADRQLHKVYELDPRTGAQIWSYGQQGLAGFEEGLLNEPSCVRRLSNGATLIVDTGNDRLLLLSPVGKLMRSFEGNAEIPITRPLHVEVMASGEMWIYLEYEDRLIRLGMGGQPVWQAQIPR